MEVAGSGGRVYSGLMPPLLAASDGLPALATAGSSSGLMFSTASPVARRTRGSRRRRMREMPMDDGYSIESFAAAIAALKRPHSSRISAANSAGVLLAGSAPARTISSWVSGCFIAVVTMA